MTRPPDDPGPSPSSGRHPAAQGPPPPPSAEDLAVSGPPRPPTASELAPKVPWRLRDLILGLIAGFLVGGVVATAFFRITDSAEMNGAETLFYAGTAIYLGAMAMTYLIAVRRRGGTLRQVGFVKPKVSALFLMLPVLFAVLVVEGTVTQLVIDYIGDTPTVQEQLLPEEEADPGAAGDPSPQPSDGDPDESLIPWLIGIAVIGAPIAEEFLFRGLLYGYLRSRRGATFAVLTSALIFAAFHFTPILIPSLFVLGVALALVYERYKSIYVPMVLHAANNLLVIVLLYATT